MKQYGSFGGSIIFTTYTNTLDSSTKIKKLIDIRTKIHSAYLQELLDRDEWVHLNKLVTDCIIKLKEN